MENDEFDKLMKDYNEQKQTNKYGESYQIDMKEKWHCEKPHVFEDHVYGYGWQRG